MDECVGGRGGAALGPSREKIVKDCKVRAQRPRRTGFHRYKVTLLQLFSRDGIRAIFGDILLDKTPLIHMSGLGGDYRVLRRLSGDCAKEHR